VIVEEIVGNTDLINNNSSVGVLKVEDDDKKEDVEDELILTQHEGNEYNTDGNYLYDISSGDAVAYKKGSKFKFYKRAKKK